MKLEEVLPALRDGKNIRRKSFETGLAFEPNDEFYIKTFTEDLLADDWEVEND
jgi:hypothetical protein